MPEPIRWSEDVEVVGPDEDAITTETVETMLHTQAGHFEEHRHGTSATHAKSHGIVVGTLEVLPGLPPELAQGLFARPATYDAVLRYASEPGQVDPDTASRARGAALKILDVPGDKLVDGWTSQDFLFNTWPVLPQGDMATYLDVIKQRDKHAGHTMATRIGTMLTHPSPKETWFDSTPNHHPVGYTYFTQAAFRYGDHVAKLALVPGDDTTRATAEQTVSKSDPPGVLATWTQEFFAGRAAVYDLRVQLCTDLETMPVEDASKEWPEDESPYRTVARLTLPAQESFSPARRVFAEDAMSWRPWNSLVEHRPLGSINRVRRRVYEELGKWRFETNARVETDPRTLTDIPT